jgi:hypothetical protein
MKCYVHQNVDAVGVCTSCGKNVCSTCAFDMGGKLLCKSCVERSFKPTAVEAETKVGKIIIADGKIVLDYPGTTKLVNNILLFTGNNDYEINIKDIQKVEYSPGTWGITVPHMKIHYGKNKLRIVSFKGVLRDSHHSSVNELTKVIEELKEQGVKTVLI